jgi:carbamate kinase
VKSNLGVLAIGGNSLIKDKNHIALSSQYEAVKETAGYIADLAAEGHAWSSPMGTVRR